MFFHVLCLYSLFSIVVMPVHMCNNYLKTMDIAQWGKGHMMFRWPEIKPCQWVTENVFHKNISVADITINKKYVKHIIK